MGGARDAVDDFDLKCPRAYGEVLRARYVVVVAVDHDGDRGDTGRGSVIRRRACGISVVFCVELVP